MKTLLVLIPLIASTTVMAGTCFTSNGSGYLNNLKTPTKICIEGFKTDLNVFANSTAKISFTLNKEEKLLVTTSVLTGKKFGNAYLVNFNVLNKEYSEGVCDLTESYSVKGTATISETGSLLKINTLKMTTSSSNDWCHDGPSINESTFTKI